MIRERTGRLLTALATAFVAAALVGAEAAGMGSVDTFAIGLEQPVSNGVPGRGAGNIETVGSVDVYELAITEPTSVYFDEVGGGCAVVWSCVSPTGADLFHSDPMCVGDPGVRVLGEVGTYTITVSAGSQTGTYSFTVWSLNAPQVFSIGFEQTVSNGQPGPGAGNIEEPGAIDRYELAVTAPQSVFIDEIAGGCATVWSCQAPSGATIFTGNPMCITDPAVLTFTESGIYTFEVSAPIGATGTYSFKIWTLEPPQEFPLVLGQTVSSGVPGPGAGSLEEPGSIDRYLLTIATPTNVYFDELSGGCSHLWTCTSPSGATIYADNPMCVTDPGQFTLLEVGTYVVEVDGGPNGAMGTYSFKALEVEPPQIFSIEIGTTILDGVPAPGAGNIEAPASIDIYTFEAEAGAAVCFLDGLGNCGVRWRLLDPSGAIVFDDVAVCVGDPGTFILSVAGTYQVVVYGFNGATGPYSIAILPSRYGDLDSDCHVTAADLAILLGAWGPCGATCPADFDGSGAVDAADLAVMLGEWG